MFDPLSQRCIALARFMLTHRSTVRQAARAFGMSKSSVHKELLRRLPTVDPDLADEVAALLRYNKSVRHLRGGEATRARYAAEKAQKTLHFH